MKKKQHRKKQNIGEKGQTDRQTEREKKVIKIHNIY